MGNIRQALLQTLATDFGKIQTSNGYNYNVKSLFKKFTSITEVKEFPSIFFAFDRADSEIIDESNDILLTKADILIVGYVGINNYDASNSATLTDEAEKLIQDIKSLVHQYKSNSTTINSLKGVQGWYIKSVEPYLDDKNNKGSVVLILEVKFIESVETNTLDLSKPNSPILVSPANSFVVTTLFPQFDWTGNDNVLGYQIQVSSDNTFSTNIINQDYLIDASFTIPLDKVLTNGNTYYWRVRAFNNYGYSDWTNGQHFSINSNDITSKNPNEIGNCKLWLDSTTGIIITSGKVSTWNDISGNSKHFTNTTANDRPTLWGNAYGSISAINFAATGGMGAQSLYNQDVSNTFSVSGGATQQKSILITTIPETQTGNHRFLIGRTNANYGGEWSVGANYIDDVFRQYDTFWTPRGGVASDMLSPIIDNSSTALQQYVWTFSATSGKAYYNGMKVQDKQVTFANTSIPAGNAGTYFTIGSYYTYTPYGGQYTGKIFHVAFFDKTLTDLEVLQLYQWHKNQFGIS